MGKYASLYQSELGELIIVANETALLSVSFNDKGEWHKLDNSYQRKSNIIIEETEKWLDQYFTGSNPNTMPNLNAEGTEFQKTVWELLRKIPYGQTITYGDLAKEIAVIRHCSKMSAQAIGQAVGKNPIPILIPCHRVVGKNGNLTGFSCGMERKVKLLLVEGQDMTKFCW